MTEIFKTINGNITKISEIEDGCIVKCISPDEVEISKLSARLNLPKDVFCSALDADEKSRYEVEDDYSMIIINIPIPSDEEGELYDTLPLAIIDTGSILVTVCSTNSPVLKFDGAKNNYSDTKFKSRFVLQLLFSIDSIYLKYLKDINRKSDEVEEKLHKSTKNKELIKLLTLEKSLVYFTTSLKSNETVLERLQRSENFKKYEEDKDLLEDVIIENKQAIEMANIYSGILSGMMDAFASVISNNLNIVMKILAIITIVMAIPTMIFSAYGMNVNMAGMPFATSPYGFLIIVSVSFLLAIIAIFVFKKLFK